jgi:RimJ/RimL family protein N-acetyltransferase
MSPAHGTDAAAHLPRGEPVQAGARDRRPERRVYEGRYVSLEPPVPERDAPDLFAGSHGSLEAEQLWTYMPYGPFADASEMEAWLVERAASLDPLFLVVRDRASDRRVGMVSFLNVAPEMRRLELGHIWYAPAAQRTRVNTESAYLMLSHSFGDLDCRRVEWKCDALNAASRRAALRLGFAFEGIFRRHLIVKERNRDTAWFSMLDSEWPRRRESLEAWLYEGAPSLSELNADLLPADGEESR